MKIINEVKSVRIEQLEYLLALKENHSIIKTAREYFISHQAMSKNIKTLQEELGVVLIEKNKHEVNLTKAGEEVCAFAEIVLREKAALDKKLQSCRTVPKYENKVQIYMTNRYNSNDFMEIAFALQKEVREYICISTLSLTEIISQVNYDDAGTLGLITVYNDMSSKLKEKLAEYNLKYLIIQSVPLCVCAYKKSLLAQNAYLTNEMLQKTPVTGFWFDAHLFDDNPRNITFAVNDYEQQKNIMKSKNAYGWYSKNELAHILGADYTALESDKKVKMQYILIYRELDETLLNKLLELINKSEIF